MEEIKKNNSNNILKGGISKEVIFEYKPIKDNENQKEINPKKEQEAKTTQTKSAITIEKAQEELKKTEDKLQEINFTTNKINKTIEEDIDYDFQILNEQIEAISPSFDMDLDLLESEKENHEPNCIEFKRRTEELNKRKEQFNKIKNEVEDNKKRVEEIRKRLKEINPVIESFIIDLQFIWEKL